MGMGWMGMGWMGMGMLGFNFGFQEYGHGS